jgi:aryl-alcohol dehydrogenase-like predicted oxidoreductase
MTGTQTPFAFSPTAADATFNRLGYGGMRLTGPAVWGEFPDRDGGVALLRRVVGAGVTFIDTTDAYGPHTNEVLIHDALYPYAADLVIATRGRATEPRTCGPRWSLVVAHPRK